MSIVSHGHDDCVERLLEQLCTLHGGHIHHVVLTHNVPSEPVAVPSGGWPFRFTELFNHQQAGFGANHNRAFGHCSTAYFCVLNPDIELSDASVWEKLLERLHEPMVGCVYPLLFNPDGSRQENERELVTPLSLVRRHLLKLPQRRVDWVSGAFWMVRAVVWRSLGGFDERFYMYCEDVDFCLRLQLAGWRLAVADAAATHDASWGSRRPGRHMAWHLRSLLRLWAGPAIRHYKARLAAPLMPQSFEFNGFGWSGENKSLILRWSGAPRDAKSFAVTVYDPDAPLGSGWCHWFVIDIPASVTELPADAGAADGAKLPTGARHVRIDYGFPGWGDPCPPVGDKPHRYVFTVHALKTDKLDIPADATAALAGFVVNANAIAKASFTAGYGLPAA